MHTLRATQCPGRAVAPRPVVARVRPRGVRCNAAQAAVETTIQTTNEDFYGILGVDPNAPTRRIRKAYLELMKDFHPDQYGGNGTEVDAANELCALLNEIYETLSDPDRRSTYDALVGFAMGGINPFMDSSQDSDQVFVDEISCIGCGKCVMACPSNFNLEASKYARARVVQQAVSEDQRDEVAMAIETCPVDCISYVTLPQLSLLETALSTMARVDVFVMRRSGSRGPSVFDAASREWQRRQAAIEAKLSMEKTVNWQWWKSRYVDDMDSVRGSSGGPSAQQAPSADSRKIARLAAVAARAARLWRAAGGSRPARALLSTSDNE